MGRAFMASYSKNTTVWGLVLSIVISVPFFIILAFGRYGPLLFNAVMASIFAVVPALLLYLTWSGRRLNYELRDDEFRVNFNPMKFRIPY